MQNNGEEVWLLSVRWSSVFHGRSAGVQSVCVVFGHDVDEQSRRPDFRLNFGFHAFSPINSFRIDLQCEFSFLTVEVVT